MQLVRRIDGRAYVDAAIIQYSAYDAFGILPEETDRTFGGFQPEISLPGPAKRTIRQAGALMKVMRALMKARKQLPKQLADLEARVLERGREDLRNLSPSELFARSKELTKQEWQPPFMLASAIGSTWLGLARQLAEKKRFNVDFEAMIGGLMAARGGVVSADHAYDLQKIGNSFETGSAEYIDAMQDWMQNYGHRGFNEFDIASARWREQPEQIARMAKEMSQTAHSPSSAQDARKVAEEMLNDLPFPSRWLIRFLTARAAEGFRIREQGKSCLVATVGLSRIIVLEWGRRLVDRGLIAKRDDVFYLTFADFWAWSTGLWDGTGAKDRVATHKTQVEDWAALSEPADVVLDNQGTMENAPTPFVQQQDGHFVGSGVSPGRAEGTAYKLTRPDEGAAFETGGILVARSTDPSWTPLFLRADGIVVEIGGYLSHGAIVAREFGLPAVVNIPGVFGEIKTGDQLMIDGGRGTVRVGSQTDVSKKS